MTSPGNDETVSEPSVDTARPERRVVVAWLGVALHLMVGVVPYAGSGLLAPGGAVMLLWALWVALLALCVTLARRGSAYALLVPFAALGLWVITMIVGDVFLGWVA